MTVAATVATAPLLAVHFGQVSLVSLPANLIAAPLVAPIMWLGMLAAGVAQVDPALAAPLSAVAAPLAAVVDGVAHAAAAVPHATLAVRLPGAVGALAGYGLLALAWWRPRARRGAAPRPRWCWRSSVTRLARRPARARPACPSWTSARATRR